MKYTLLLLFILLPLQWFVVRLPVPGLGARPLYYLGVLAVTGAVVLAFRFSVFRPVIAFTAPFVAAYAVLVTVWLGTGFYHGQGFRDQVEQAALVVTIVALAGLTYRGLSRPDSGFVAWARWSALACTGSFLIALAVSVSVNGIDAGGVLQRTLQSANPDILTSDLFNPAFEGFGLSAEEAKSQLRHEANGAVLTAVYISAAAALMRPFRSRVALLLYRVSMVVSLLILVASLSRSVIIALLAWPLLAFWRTLRSGTMTSRQVAVAGTAAVGVGGLLASGLLSVIWLRFTQDTSSYASRETLLQDALANIRDNWLTGGVSTVGASSHNLVLDTWLRAGVFAAAAAVVILGLMIALWLGLASRLHLEPAWLLPITGALTLPIVRAFTIGGGALPPVQCVCLGLVAGFVTWRLTERARERELRRRSAEPLPQMALP